MQINPVLLSGIKIRMRGVKAPILMSVYFALLLLIFALVYASMGNVDSFSYYYSVPRPRPQGTELLIPLYSVLVSMLFAIVVLMVPALNAGNIASEREKQTLDLLIISRMSAIKIVLGKVFSNLAFIVFLLVLTMPVFAVTYLLGSIMILDILKTFYFMVVSAYACASLATFFSALVKKTSIATILTYVTLVLFEVLTIVFGVYLMVVYERRIGYNYDNIYLPLMMRINPLLSVAELLAAAESNAGGGSDFLSYIFDEFHYNFLAYSTGFMLLASPLLNIASAILIKPVQKLQIRR